MQPRVIGSFEATGGDGRRYTVEVVRGYLPGAEAGPGGRRVEDGLAEFRTPDGMEVRHAGGEDGGRFWIVNTGVWLDPDLPFADILALADGR